MRRPSKDKTQWIAITILSVAVVLLIVLLLASGLNGVENG